VSAARRLVAAGLTAVLLAGCSGSEPPSLSPEAARVLGTDVDAVAAAARAQDLGALRGALQALRSHVEQYQARDELSPERSSRIMAAAALVATDVEPPAPAAPAAPEPPAPAAPEPAAPQAVPPAAPPPVRSPAPRPAAASPDPAEETAAAPAGGDDGSAPPLRAENPDAGKAGRGKSGKEADEAKDGGKGGKGD